MSKGLWLTTLFLVLTFYITRLSAQNTPNTVKESDFKMTSFAFGGTGVLLIAVGAWHLYVRSSNSFIQNQKK